MTRILLLALLLLASPANANDTRSWLTNGKPTPQATALLRALATADLEGLRPADYTLGLSAAEFRSVEAGQADAALSARFEQSLTASAIRFVTHLTRGRVSAAEAGFQFPTTRPLPDPSDTVAELAHSADPKAVLASLQPKPRPYHLLRSALGDYRPLAQRADLTQLPTLPKRKLLTGDGYDGTSKLRRLLSALGDLDKDLAVTDEQHIDAELTAAIARFQARHGLQPDGVLGARTYAAMTKPLNQRVHQLELAMERWRWLSAMQRPDIVINVPQFMLYALPRPGDAEPRVIEMGVIVGTPDNRTPMFTARIEQVIFQPFWDVPASITRNELLPKIRKDPGYLERHHFEIVRGQSDQAMPVAPSKQAFDELQAGRLRLRQRPGPDNALGPVKFVLPNPYQVRLHGTSEPRLFEQSTRAFSHGCIRVSEPAVLAQYVLRNAPGDWNSAAVDAALCGEKTLRVILTQPVNVVVFYATAAATESRGVLFSDDIYGHDQTLDRLLERAATAR